MFNEFLKKTQELYRNRSPFAIAFVVNRQVPSSGKPGDKAVIETDGTITGWIGGGCTRGIVLKEAGLAIYDGKPRLLRISPNNESVSKPGVMEYKMTCHSGGEVEIYIEPVLPKPEIIIMGKSQVAFALNKLAKAMDYSVTVSGKGVDQLHFPGADLFLSNGMKDHKIGPNTCIVVCTQGENDEFHLQEAIESGAAYVAFVASRRKANTLFKNLRTMGVDFDALKKIKTPAGLDINAKLPEEVAVSILAEIVAFIRDEERNAETIDKQSAIGKMPENEAVFINPVCQVPVEKATAKHVIEYKEMNYYFCCDGCKVSFEKDPDKYALVV